MTAAPTPALDPIPNPIRAPHTEFCPHAHPHLNLAPQSAPLKAAVKSEPATGAESCGAKSPVPPSSVKALLLTSSLQPSTQWKRCESRAVRTMHTQRDCTLDLRPCLLELYPNRNSDKKNALLRVLAPEPHTNNTLPTSLQSVSLNLKSKPAKSLVPLRRRRDKASTHPSMMQQP